MQGLTFLVSRRVRLAHLLACAAIAAVLTAAGCSHSASDQSQAVKEPTAASTSVSVAIVRPAPEVIRLSVRQPGSIQAFEQTPMFAKIAGYVSKWNVDRGDHVKKDDVLAELDVPEMVEELKQKEEMVKQARESAEVAKARAITAAAQVKEAQAGLPRAEYDHQYWRLYYDRIAKLDKTLEPQVKEETWNRLQSAAAAQKEAEAKVETALASSREAEAVRKKAQIDIGAAEKDRDRLAALLSYTRLKAPYAGVVTRRSINTGDFVQPPTGGKGDPLYIVERRDRMRVVVDVPESDATWVGYDAPARVRVQGLQWQEFVGTVARTSYAVDRTTRTLVAEIDLENPKDHLRPGMYAIAVITGEHRAALALPTSAVLTQGDVTQGYQKFCFQVRDDKAERLLVQVGLSDGKFVEVLRKQQKASKAGEERWEDFTGSENIAATAGALTEGQSVIEK